MAEWSAIWLIGFGAKVDVVNSHGDSPLHMLLKSDSRMCSVKLVKELIFKGADKNLKNRLGQRPIDLLSNIEDAMIAKEIKRMLGEQPLSMPCFQWN